MKLFKHLVKHIGWDEIECKRSHIFTKLGDRTLRYLLRPLRDRGAAFDRCVTSGLTDL